MTWCDTWRGGNSLIVFKYLFLVLWEIELFQCTEFADERLVLTFQYGNPVLKATNVLLLFTSALSCCLSAWKWVMKRRRRRRPFLSYLFFMSLISLFLVVSSPCNWGGDTSASGLATVRNDCLWPIGLVLAADNCAPKSDDDNNNNNNI